MPASHDRIGLPRVFDVNVVCPAGRPIAESAKGSGVFCRLTRSAILSQEDSESLGFCCSEAYRRCPVWQAEKERIEEGRRVEIVDDNARAMV